MKILFLTKYPKAGASSRYRVFQYLPYLEEGDMTYEVESFFSDQMYSYSLRPGRSVLKIFFTTLAVLRRLSVIWRCRNFDLIFMQREALPFGPLLLERWFRFLGIRTIFDYDDALFIFKENANSRIFNLVKDANRVTRIMSLVDCVFAGNTWLRDSAANYCNDSRTVYVAEDLGRYSLKSFDSNDNEIVIGWLGSPSTEKYLQLIREPLRELSLRFPQLRLKIIGGGNFSDDVIRVDHVQWNYDTEVAELHSFDVGVMPLPLEDWSKGKSGGKARTYMAVGLPVVCTGIGFNLDLVNDQQTGYLVTEQKEWLDTLAMLIESPNLRQEIGLAARAEVKQRFALEKLGPDFVSQIASAGAR